MIKKVLLFDLDDTLVPSSHAYDIGMKALGIEPDDERYLQARAEVKAICPPGYPATRSRRLYFKRYLEIGQEYTPLRHLEIVDVYETAVTQAIGDSWQALERDRLFARLRAIAGVIGIVSNETAAMQSAKLAACDPRWQHFDFIVTSEEVGYEKPNPVMFRRALEFAGGVQPSECLFIGDNYEMDIVGSTSLGFDAIQSLEFVAEPRRHSMVIEKLDELIDVLPAIFGA